MNTRTKVKTTQIDINDDVEFTNTINKIAEIKQKKLAIKAEVEAFKLRITAEVKELDADDKKYSKQAALYATAHRAQLITTGKHSSTSLAKYGFRAISASITTLSGYNEQSVISKLETEQLNQYVRLNKTLNKTAISDDLRDHKINRSQLTTWGLTIKGGIGENFFIELLDNISIPENLEEDEEND